MNPGFRCAASGLLGIAIAIMSLATSGESNLGIQPKGEPDSRSPADQKEKSLSVQEVQRIAEQIKLQQEALDEENQRKSKPKQTYEIAPYVKDWERKVDAVAEKAFPRSKRKGWPSGDVKLSVGINFDGSLNTVNTIQSSGHQTLDEAALKIVQFAAPFSPFPSRMRDDFDVLYITRTWHFDANGDLELE